MNPEFSKKLKKFSKQPEGTQQVILGAFLSKFFREQNVSFTIVGGAAVQFYTQSEYQTKDLDAVLEGDTKEIIENVMGNLGFKRTSMYRHFENPLFKFVVEFPPSPVEIGSRIISEVAEIKTVEGPVRMVRIEDIIMDRIVAGVEWKDEPSIQQAKLLWIKNKDEIDRKYLKKFAEEEGYSEILKEIMKG